MSQAINLLRWREKRRRRCLRLWLLLLAGLCLISTAVWLHGFSVRALSHTWRAAITENQKPLSEALSQREQHLKEQQQRWHERALLEKQRASTQQWQGHLQALAEQLPEQAWLTTLQWQNETLHFTGVASQFSALARLAQVVKQLPGFQPGTAGAVHRDDQGRWQFSYQLLKEVEHESPR